MKVINGFVEWNPGYDQPPNLHVVVENEPPQIDEFTFQPDKNKHFWWARHEDGYYKYFAGHPDKPGEGFGGDSYTLPTKNGTVTLKGPFSSRAGIVNKLGYGPCVDVRLHVGSKNAPTKLTTIDLEYAQQAAEHAGVTLYKDYARDGEEFAYRVHNDYPPHWHFETPRQSLTHRPPLNIRHTNGARITVEPITWEEEKRFPRNTDETVERTSQHAVLYDENNTKLDETYTSRLDVGVHYLMAQHDNRTPPRKAKNAPEETDKIRTKLPTTQK